MLPMALPLATVVVGSKNEPAEGNLFTVVSTSSYFSGENRFSFTSRDIRADTDSPKWAKYILGVMDNFHKKDIIHGFNALIHSSVPIGT